MLRRARCPRAALVGAGVAGRVHAAHAQAHGQHVSLGAVEQVDREEVACQDGPGLRTQELRPGWPGPPRCGVDAVGLEDLPYGRCRDLDSQPGQLAVDPAVAPFVFSRVSRRTSALIFRRIAGRPVLPRMDLVARQRRTMSRRQRRIVSGVTSSRNPWRRPFGITPSSAASRAPVRPVQLRAAQLLPLQDRELMAQN